MATTSAEVNGTTTPNDWTLAAGVSKQAAVSSPDDDATSYIDSSNTSGTVQTFTVTPPLNQGDTITQIDINVRAKRGGTLDANYVVGYSFTPQAGGTQSGQSATFTAATNWNSSTFTHADLSVPWGNNLTVNVRNTQGRRVLVTTLNLTITYTPGPTGPAAGVFAHAHRMQLAVG
ncbi:MAG: hypothetical protein K1X50_01780 [Candidatus Promineofilum sp.]|nr:hypothetical protein [Promineifilum sp.]